MAERIISSRRAFLFSSLAGTALLLPDADIAAAHAVPLDRARYDRYIRLMNVGDLRFVDYYADDIKFIMNIRGKVDILDFYARQRPYVREQLEVLFFCSDAAGAAAQVNSEIRCIKDCADATIFGRSLKAGEVQRIRGCLLYRLNAQGKISEIAGPPPEIMQPWRMEAT